MSDLFDLPVTYNGKEMLFPSEFLPMGFSHKIKVTINGTDLLFEPDEERSYRAVAGIDEMHSMQKLDAGLLRTICETLDELFGI